MMLLIYWIFNEVMRIGNEIGNEVYMNCCNGQHSSSSDFRGSWNLHGQFKRAET